MRLFQNGGLYPKYIERLDRLTKMVSTFSARRNIFLNDGYGAVHFLKPVLDGDQSAFFTNGDDTKLQRAWASEKGMPSKASLEDILLAQIEEHQTEVFYNLDPMSYGNTILKRIPGCVKNTLTWRAAPSSGGNFLSYDIMLNNFPSILENYRQSGMQTAYFFPGHDPKMDSYSLNEDRPIDVLFVGGYSRHHRKRADILNAVAKLRNEFQVKFHLDRSRLTQLAETPAGWIGPLTRYRRPKDIRAVSAEPVFGTDLYQAISKAKIVVNAAVDMAGNDRGNIRCWEAMGCGALLITDQGNYPEGMKADKNIVTYQDGEDAVRKIRTYLSNVENTKRLANSGNALIKNKYSKESQWNRFLEIVG